MSSYEHLLKTISRNIKYLNKNLSDFYEFEEKARVVGASITSKDLTRIKQLENDVAMFSGLCDANGIEFEEELEQSSATLYVE